MSKVKELVGQRFGKLLVIERAGSDKHGRALWLCKCDCGNTCIVKGADLLRKDNKHTTSCGCKRKEGYRKTHGLIKHPLYKTWSNIKSRCYNKNTKSYKYYGGRGIIVCEEWLNNFETFYNWAISNGYKGGLSIDRINVNGNYEPNNCRWVDNITQANNKTDNVYITYNSETHTATEWDRICNYPSQTINRRIKSGWDLDKIFNTPVQETEYIINYRNKEMTIKELAEIVNLNPYLLYSRIFRYGWTVEKAVNTHIQGQYLYKGNVYTRQELCKMFNISISAFKARQSKGWTLEDILNTPVKTHRNKT